MNKKFSPFALISIFSLVAMFIVSFFIKDFKTMFLVNIIMSIVAIISAIIALATMRKRNQKGKPFAIIAIILGLMILFGSILLSKGLDLLMDPKVTADGDICQNAVKCVDKDGVSTCKFKGVEQIQMKCNTDLLKKDQMK